MRYLTFLPAPDLRPLIDSYWVLEGSADDSPGVERAMPDGHCDLAFHLGDGFDRLLPGGAVERQASALWVGQMEQCAALLPTGRVLVFGVRFRPHGAAMFSGHPQHETNGAIVDLGALWPRSNNWRQRLGEGADHAARARIADEMLRAMRLPLRADPRLAAAVRMLIQAPNSAMDAVANTAGWSARQLERAFLGGVGMRPKTFAQIRRFQSALELRRCRPGWSWTNIAAEAGYYDQPHMIADFRRFAGEAPNGCARSASVFEELLARPPAKSS